jgi:tRNA threonylcarbamoyl adenosine modification protein YjeE
MLSRSAPRATWDVLLPDEGATERLAMDLAVALEPGDVVTLSGDLGAGKTTLVRAIIRYLAGNSRLEVPSPTFTLLQTYDLPPFVVVHSDLYRIESLSELAELGWDETPEGAVLFVEWPERAGEFLQVDRLDIALSIAPDLSPTHRRVRLSGYGAWIARLERLRAVRALIDAAGFGPARRRRIKGDASTRSYERLALSGTSVILMNAPPRPDGPPVRNGLPYSAIAHLAENMRPYVAIARFLREQGFSTPEIIAADIESGLLLIEDLGNKGIVSGDPPAAIEERYMAAIDVLIALHALELPGKLPVAPRLEYALPDYDIDAYLVEVELLLDWYLPLREAVLPGDARIQFETLWRTTLKEIVEAPKTWVLRDYHSPNLLWLPERRDVARIGLLDFQDAVQGSHAYDVASLLMDARAEVSEQLELKLLSRYAIGRNGKGSPFDPATFARHYVTLGAQRATKILGIFARLERRDGKPDYLKHLPRVWRYLVRALAHPSLAGLKAWYGEHVPPPPS